MVNGAIHILHYYSTQKYISGSGLKISGEGLESPQGESRRLFIRVSTP
jgi:hypothetical protein